VRVPQEFAADDYVQLMGEYGFPGGLLEMDSEYKRAQDHAAFLGVAERAERPPQSG